MYKDLIYFIRENKELYNYLKYNSYLYQKIFRGELNYKDLNNLMKKGLKLTLSDKLSNINEKIELANSFINILK